MMAIAPASRGNENSLIDPADQKKDAVAIFLQWLVVRESRIMLLK